VTYVKIPVPRLDAGFLSNALGIIGLTLLIIAPGGITGNAWWSVIAGGIVGVLLSYLTALRTEEHIADTDKTQPYKQDIRLAK